MHETCLVIIHAPSMRPGPVVEELVLELALESTDYSSESADSSLPMMI